MAQQRTGRLIALPVVVTVVACVVGLGVGIGVGALYIASVSSDDAWGDLAGVALGLVTAAATAVLAWVVGITVAARRAFVPGRRLRAALLALALATGLAVLALVVVDAATPLLHAAGFGSGGLVVALGGFPVQLTALVVAVAAGGVLGFLLAERLDRSRVEVPPC